MTLRQLYYRLVSEQAIPNDQSAYNVLSRKIAQARRDGAFPDLIDRGREIHVASCWSSPADALHALADQYRVDRTEGQEASVFLGVEKAGLVRLMQSWFGEYGTPVLALGGYASQSYVEQIRRDVARRDRPAVLLYAGDFDPSGEDIDRDLIERTGCWAETRRVALSPEQIIEHQLPVNPGKVGDSRARAFTERHGALVQVEVDALDPGTLRGLFEAALAPFVDTSIFHAVRDREDVERAELRQLADRAGDD